MIANKSKPKRAKRELPPSEYSPGSEMLMALVILLLALGMVATNLDTLSHGYCEIKGGTYTQHFCRTK